MLARWSSKQLLILVFSKCFHAGFWTFFNVQIHSERGHKFIKLNLYHIKTFFLIFITASFTVSLTSCLTLPVPFTCLYHSLPHLLPASLTPLPHSLTLSHSLPTHSPVSLTHSFFTPCLTHFLHLLFPSSLIPSHPTKLPPSLLSCLTHSLLTPSLPHSLTHCFTHSLSRSLLSYSLPDIHSCITLLHSLPCLIHSSHFLPHLFPASFTPCLTLPAWHSPALLTPFLTYSPALPHSPLTPLPHPFIIQSLPYSLPHSFPFLFTPLPHSPSFTHSLPH